MRITVGQLRRIIRETIEEETGRRHVREGLLDSIKGLFGGGKINAIAQALFPDYAVEGGSNDGDEIDIAQLRKDLITAGYDKGWADNTARQVAFKFAGKNLSAKTARVGDDTRFRRSLMKHAREKWLLWAKPGDKGMKTIKAEFGDIDPQNDDAVKQMRSFFTKKGAPGSELLNSFVYEEDFEAETSAKTTKAAGEKAEKQKAANAKAGAEFQKHWDAMWKYIRANSEEADANRYVQYWSGAGESGARGQSEKFIDWASSHPGIRDYLVDPEEYKKARYGVGQ
jgi:hypothetical protein